MAVNVARSSFSTSARRAPTSARAWPTTAPTGIGRLVVTVANVVPRTVARGPPRNSARSTRWLPTSASTPEPAPPR